jgi:hypothetical protein
VRVCVVREMVSRICWWAKSWNISENSRSALTNVVPVIGCCNLLVLTLLLRSKVGFVVSK